MKYEIKNRYTGSVIYAGEFDDMKSCVESAVKAKADLRSADLISANLYSADLRSADLSSANLRSDNLILQFGPIGSRKDYLIILFIKNTIEVNAGCFHGTLDEFKKKVKDTHGDSFHSIEYFAAIEAAEKIIAAKKEKTK